MTEVLLTGVTGFLGKVVLYELLRRRRSLGVERIHLLIRPNGRASALERFAQEVRASACFETAQDGWERHCEVVEGNLLEPRLGLDDAAFDALASRVTHVIHGAAAIQFDRPLEETARTNIDGALRVMDFALACPGRAAFVHVSTAFVWPLQAEGQPLGERLVPLPFDAQHARAALASGDDERDHWLDQTGHVNAYTFTKCLAEHLLVARHGSLPLRIVRPSIICASAERPTPGWIDSPAAYTGLVVLYGAGVLRVAAVHPDCRPDIIPCDEVVDHILESCFSEKDQGLTIHNAAVGIERTARAADITDVARRYFARYPTGAKTVLRHIDAFDPKLRLLEFVHQRAPLALAHGLARVGGQEREAKQISKIREVLFYMNRGFRFATHHTWRFETSRPPPADFDPLAYHEVICLGVHRFILHHGDDQVPLAGRKHRSRRDDLAWSVRLHVPNATQRVLGLGLRKLLRSATDLVTFDQRALENALASRLPGDTLVLVPSHRSYLDFLLLPYLCAERSSLGLKAPAILATEDFARNPLMARVLEQGHAIWIKRGHGEDPDLEHRLATPLQRGMPLMFFVEGTRSRGRHTLPPKRGVLRALQRTGRRFLLVPLSLGYDRVPEERHLVAELRGSRSRIPQLAEVLAWHRRARRGEVRLGRIHIGCGQTLRLDDRTDVQQLSLALTEQLQRAGSLSDFHLRCFLSAHSIPGVDALRLRRLLRARGVTVVHSALPVPESLDPILERMLRQQWMHALYQDVRLHAPDNPALQAHIRLHDRGGTPAAQPLPAGILSATFGSVARAHAEVALHLARRPASGFVRRTIADELPAQFRPDVLDAIDELHRRGLLASHHEIFRPCASPAQLRDHAERCRSLDP